MKQFDFRIDILRNGIKVGQAFAESVRIHYDYNAEVMKGMQFSLIKTEMASQELQFDMFKDRLRPVLISDGKETPLGVFMIVAAPVRYTDVVDSTEIEAYDETMIVKQAAFENRQYWQYNTKYTDIIQGLLTSLGFANIRMDASTAKLSDNLEAAVGDNYLEFINNLLDSMNFQHLYADANGDLQIRKAVNPTEAQFKYSDTHNYALIDEIRRNTDIYDLPNVVVGVYSSADKSNPVVYKKVNDDPNSIISTVNRGYRVVQKVNVKNGATLADLTAYVERIAFEAMQTTETVEFTTIAEGGHEPNTAVQLDTNDVRGLFVEKAWTISISQTQLSMSHTAERKVFV